MRAQSLGAPTWVQKVVKALGPATTLRRRRVPTRRTTIALRLLSRNFAIKKLIEEAKTETTKWLKKQAIGLG